MFHGLSMIVSFVFQMDVTGTLVTDHMELEHHLCRSQSGLLSFTLLLLGLVDLSLSLGEASLELLDRLATLLVEQVFVGERDSDSGEETDASGDADPSENFGRGVHRGVSFRCDEMLVTCVAFEHDATSVFLIYFVRVSLAPVS